MLKVLEISDSEKISLPDLILERVDKILEEEKRTKSAMTLSQKIISFFGVKYTLWQHWERNERNTFDVMYIDWKRRGAQ